MGDEKGVSAVYIIVGMYGVVGRKWCRCESETLVVADLLITSK
jgi:hypothetical protein